MVTEYKKRSGVVSLCRIINCTEHTKTIEKLVVFSKFYFICTFVCKRKDVNTMFTVLDLLILTSYTKLLLTLSLFLLT